ncbi:hypothetical protein CkaCkLH20_11257 [Colletotrichum karsti]|uniref:Uncharacterized protein n=1 Tax=Colletotrichum karsti TaxID=1095194 RepID=A0A9P6LFM8_9PEZI|nr:uncharacterized protein CkaCkLH20_11257 [Colletotrichum karsti]KAF9871336.1 hypothetical protein CkaCkLH20_11257 [Colletotrichum karsti]
MQTNPTVSLSNGFLRLPRELRDVIYKMYVTVDGGYKCDSNILVESKLRGEARGRLTQANGEPIDLSLAYTCRIIANEMRGLALQTNNITFSTFYSDGLRCHLNAFDFWKKDGLDQLRIEIFDLAREFLTGPVCDQLAAAYPQFVPLLDHMRTTEASSSTTIVDAAHYREAPSVYKEFVKRALQLASSPNAKRFAEEMDRLCRGEKGAKRWQPGKLDILRVIDCPIEAWDIPSQDDLLEVVSYGYFRFPAADDETPEALIKSRESDNSKYRLSAASLAVQFLSALPKNTRSFIRNIMLNEDRDSVAESPCHARGLIPYCQENRLLRVERRADLWWNVLRKHPYLSPEQRISRPQRMKLFSNQVTRNVAVWVVEASILSSAGMPPGSFSLVLDAGPAPQLAEAIFQQVVQRDIAWHLACDEAVRRGYVPELSWEDRRCDNDDGLLRDGRTFENFPNDMENVASRRSVVRFTFDVGALGDVGKLVEESRDYDHDDWNEVWDSHDPKTWETVSPLPQWKEILMDNVVSRGETTTGERGSSTTV